MKTTQALMTMALTVAAMSLAGPANAAPDCIQVDVDQPVTLCSGQATAVGVDVANACAAPKKITMTFAVDQLTMPVKAQAVVPGEATLSKQALLLVPSNIRPGSHTLTVTATDASGDVSSTDISVIVESCATR